MKEGKKGVVVCTACGLEQSFCALEPSITECPSCGSICKIKKDPHRGCLEKAGELKENPSHHLEVEKQGVFLYCCATCPL